MGRALMQQFSNISHIFEEGQTYKFYYCKAGLYEFVLSYEKVY